MNVPWITALFGQVVWELPHPHIDLVVQGTGMMRVSANKLDAACLDLFPRGTTLLVQIQTGVLLDWTLYPPKGFDGTGGTGGYTVPGDEWKNG